MQAPLRQGFISIFTTSSNKNLYEITQAPLRRDLLCQDLHEIFSQARPTFLCEPAQSKCTWTYQKSHTTRLITRKIPPSGTGNKNTLWEPTQSKCTWTSQKKSFMMFYARISKKKSSASNISGTFYASLRNRKTLKDII